MRVFIAISLLCIILIETQSKSISDNKQASGGSWQPNHGQDRDEWLRCHGFPCNAWERTRRKLQDFKMITAGINMDPVNLLNDTDDSLDNCIWLTEDQLDQIFLEMEQELEAKSGRANSIGTKPLHPEGYMAEYTETHKEHSRQKRKVTNFAKYPFNKWPTTVVHWKFDGDHTGEERDIVRGAFSHWQEQTCMRFVELGTSQPFSDNHILVTRKLTGCHSFVGRITVIPQQLNLQPECLYNLGTPVHEIGHALGLWHEQQRSDRDSAIRVLWDNLGYYVGQFYKQATDNLTPYDYDSVMHYGPMDGTKNGKLTMETINPLYQHNIGQRTGLSYLDAKAINIAYCSDVCTVRLAGCRYGSYQDPKECSRCKCPDGLSGTYCDQLASPVNADCGGELTVSADSPLYIQSPRYGNGHYNNYVTCAWRVKAPQGSHVSLTFEGQFSIYAYYQAQCHHWLEVRYKQDIGEQGPRFCGYSRPDSVVTSEGDELLIVFRSNWTTDSHYARLGFRAKLQLVGSAVTQPPTTTQSSTTTSTQAPTTTTRRTTVTTAATTPMPTRSTTVLPTVPTNAGSDCDVADVMLVMDSSGGVMEDNWPNILHFAKNIVRRLNIAKDNVRVGVITYSSNADVSIPLGAHDNVNDVTAALDGIKFLGGSTNTHVGLVVMRAEFSSYARANARKIALLITDGQTALPSIAIQQASFARAEGIELYVAGIHYTFDYQEAASMVEDKKHIIQIESFSDLVSPMYNYGLAVQELICPKDTMQTSSSLSWSCDFESDAAPFCDMIQETSHDQFNWTRYTGPTPSGATGPEEAFDGKYYAYIEASNPRQPGDTAVLYLPEFGALGDHCLTFAYNMYGYHIRTIQVLKRSAARSMIPLWMESGQKGKSWLQARVSVSLQFGDQLLLVGKRGNAYSGDIAIDNIRLTGGACT